MKALDEFKIIEGKKILHRIVSMLTKMTKLAGEKREDPECYGSHKRGNEYDYEHEHELEKEGMGENENEHE
jgi:hypothetical protein